MTGPVKKASRRPRVVQIQAIELEGRPALVALFDDGQLMLGRFLALGCIEWGDLRAPIPKDGRA